MKKELYNRIQKIIIKSDSSILMALKQMDMYKKKLLLVFDDNVYINVLSIGDIQRAIINNIPYSESIDKILREDTKYATLEDSKKSIQQLMFDLRIECMPILDANKQLVDVVFWEDVLTLEKKPRHISTVLPVVIMAGGKGSRLKPLTNIVPKPLLPINSKTIIENIMDSFVSVGCDDFFISVNYKANTIKDYLLKLNSYKNLSFFQETKPLGTVGSLFLIKDKIKTTFFISNCDILIDADYSEILKYHRENRNEITVVSALKHYHIPYGIIETVGKGLLKELKEKPDLTFQINTGVYILEPHLLNEIPDNEFFHITDLIERIVERKGRVGVFPINEGAWKDFGTWNDYLYEINK